jgi:hypothetical protein
VATAFLGVGFGLTVPALNTLTAAFHPAAVESSVLALFGEKELSAIAAAVAGGVIAFYQLGDGIAAFRVGPLLDNGTKPSTVYGVSAAIAAAMGIASFGVTRARPATLSGPSSGS